MNCILNQIKNIGLVPVVEIDDERKAVPLAKALIAGGINCAEITFRTECAQQAIKNITTEVPQMLIGAGTILTIEQLDKAVSAGSKFVVTPGFNPSIIEYAIKKGVLIIPGTAVPGEMEHAIRLGLEVVKFFPAENNGGLSMIKAVSAPYQNLRFMPTGGINEKNIVDYIRFDRIVACGGSWMVNKKLIDEGKFDEITALSKQAIKSVLGFKLAHIGINCKNDQEALETANLLSLMFDFDIQDGESSIFSGNRGFEIMKKPFLGKNGHIAIYTNSLPVAINYLRNKGFKFNEETISPFVAYLEGEIAGFAIHLLQYK